MPLTKVCPRCSTPVHVRKAACLCGHVFIIKLVATRKSRRLAMKCKRALDCESDALKRKDNDKHARATKRALEPEDKALQRKQHNRESMAKMRALEPEDKALHIHVEGYALMCFHYTCSCSQTHGQISSYAAVE